MTIRPLHAEDLPAYGDICRYAFAMGKDYTEFYQRWVGRNLPCTRGAFDRDRLLAGMWYYPYLMRVGAHWVPSGGIAAVATRPEARNRGLVRQMMLSTHRQMREEGRPLGVLMPFKNSYYAQMGYADVFFHRLYEFRPDQVEGRPSRMQLVAADGQANWKTLEFIRQEFGQSRFGTVRRDSAYWKARYFQSWRGIGNVYLIEDAAPRKKKAVPAGYLITTISTEEGFGKVQLTVNDAAWLNTDALTAILAFLRAHRDQVQKVRWFTPADLDLFPWLTDPAIECYFKAKMMLKLVDFPAAVELRGYDPDLCGSVLFTISGDSTSPWNTGAWKVEFAGGHARVRKHRGSLGKLSQAACDIQTLAVLYSGWRTPSMLKEEGRLSGSAGSIELLTRAFPSAVPHMEEWF